MKIFMIIVIIIIIVIHVSIMINFNIIIIIIYIKIIIMVDINISRVVDPLLVFWILNFCSSECICSWTFPPFFLLHTLSLPLYNLEFTLCLVETHLNLNYSFFPQHLRCRVDTLLQSRESNSWLGGVLEDWRSLA